MSWQIDPAHSMIHFSVKHMMITKVRGVFEEFSGVIDLDQKVPANTTVEIKINSSSINTRQGQRDEHLRSPDFLDAANFPNLTFKSTKVEILSDQTAKLFGDLTIKNETNPVVIDVKFNGISKSPWGATSAGFDGHTVINRKDWGLTWNQALETGGVLVGEEIDINIELELVQQ